MKSLTGTFASARGWALLLTLFIGAGLMAAACGDEETPAPTTPTPAPPPAPPPEPEPEAPATPTGLHVDEATASSITWHWTAVEGAVGYVVQASMDETWEATDTVSFDGAPFTTATEYTASGLDPETTVYVRVASAAGTVEAPVVSAFSTHVTGMTTAAAPTGPPAPANLRVKEQGSDFIEWEWNAVEGASGYQSQFSRSATFPVSTANSVYHSGMNATTRKVSNLDAESDGYLRVRAYAGTQAEPAFGDWTEGSKGTTDEPPPVVKVALSAPTGVATGSLLDTSITVTWDSVDDADSYEVEQQTSGGSWGAANCGSATGSGTVTATSCVASGLTKGTGYSFRVRAVPDSSDETSETSDWSSTVSATTTGELPPPPITDNGGDLNVRWGSGATSITWNWDPADDRKQRERIEHLVFVAAGDECESVVYVAPESTISTSLSVDNDANDSTAWTNVGRNISVTRTGLLAGNVRTLCVVRTWKEDLGSGVEHQRFGTAAVVPAATAPSAIDAGELTNNDNTKKTTAITWRYDVDKDFTYALRVLSASENKDRPTAADCEDGTSVASPPVSSSNDASVAHRDTSPKAYFNYSLCVQATNTYGKSTWTMSAGAKTTYPGKPNKPALDGTYSVVSEEPYSKSQIVERLVWSVKDSTSGNVPDDKTKYQLAVIRTESSSSVKSSDCDTAFPLGGVTKPDNTDSDDDGGTVGIGGTIVRTRAPTGLEFTLKRRDGVDDLNKSASNAIDLGTARFYLCVRAKAAAATPGGEGPGPWSISDAKSVTRKIPSTPTGLKASKTVNSSDSANVDVKLSWSDTGNSYDVQLATVTRTRTGTGTTNDPYTAWTAWGSWPDDDAAATVCDDETTTACTHTGAYDTAISQSKSRFRVKATANDVGGSGRNLESTWSGWVEFSHNQ